MLLSICIPTFNRAEQLDNCLNSILISQQKYKLHDFEVCISDNNSKDNTKSIIEKYRTKLNINYSENSENIGFAKNAMKVVDLAKGKYSWIIGDDDLVLPDTFNILSKILKSNLNIEIFFLNSYYLNSDIISQSSKPFNTLELQFINLQHLSKVKEDKIVHFWDLIDPNISWEFLIGIFLIVFKTSKWIQSSKKVDIKKLDDKKIWSNFENTCFFPVVNAYAFKNSKAYICSRPLSINIIGYREWKNYYEFVEIIRLPELLDFYRIQGLPLLRYLYCKNFALRNFSNYLIKILISSKVKGIEYLNFKKHFVNNLLFPNVYFSIFYFVIRKVNNLFRKKI